MNPDDNAKPYQRLTPSERIRIAKSLLKRAATDPGLPSHVRAEARRHAYSLVALNLSEAKAALRRGREQISIGQRQRLRGEQKPPTEIG